MKSLNSWLILFLLFCVSGGHAAEPLAIVTDITGGAIVGGQSVEILSELADGDVVDLKSEGRLHLVYYSDGREFVYNGPARFEMAQDMPVTLSGAEPNSQSVMPDGDGSISTVGLAQAAVVMRAAPNDSLLTLRVPVETMLLQPPRQFVWQELADDVGYAFELTDSEGRSLLESIVTSGHVSLPDHIVLQPGQDYTWSVGTRLPDGRKFSSYAGFTVADEEMVAQVESNRPGDDAGLSQLIVFALWLEQNDLLIEAREYWRMASERRPADKGLRMRAEST